jgi:predicted ATP-grasp superfamily ATP-dependent carboligase
MKLIQKEIVIVGAGPQALFLVREYSRIGYSVTLVGRQKEIAMHSRYAVKLLVDTEEDLIHALTGLASQAQVLDCIVASGFYLSFLMNNFPDFFKLFNVFPKDVEALSVFLNKLNTYQLAGEINCKYPKSILLNQLNQDTDYKSFNFPQIVKWNQDIYLYQKPSFKTCLVKDAKELKNLVQTLIGREKESLVMQEYLGEDLRNNFSFGAYFDHGKLVAGICVNEVRHYRSGVSSVVEEYRGEFAELIEEKSIQLIGKTSFTGFLDVEFKIYNGEPYLLEVNPRPFGFIKIMKLKYPDLIPYILGECSSNYKNPKQVQWMNVLRDMVLVARNPKKILHMFSVLFNFNNRTFDVWDIRDLRPFFQQVKR